MSTPSAEPITTPTPTAQPQPPAFTTHIFTSTMTPISDLTHYPLYLRRGGATTKSNPILRARKIFDQGTKQTTDNSCTNCLRKDIDCIRYDDKFTKCCWCTSEDLHPVGMCHLNGAPEPEEGGLSLTARGKKRRMDLMLDSGKTSSPTGVGQSSFQIDTPNKAAKKSAEHRLPRPQVGAVAQAETAQTSPYPFIKQTPVKVDATVERIAALEDKVSILDGKVMELQGKIDELTSMTKSGQETADRSANDLNEGTVEALEVASDNTAMESVELLVRGPVAGALFIRESSTGTLIGEICETPERIIASPSGPTPARVKSEEPEALPGLSLE